jgi:hypothetical protein
LKEKSGTDKCFYSVPEINLIIATLTDPNIDADTRYANNFFTTLYPLYNSLLSAIHYSRYFRTYSPKTIEHTKINRLYWGKSGEFANVKNIFGDWLDAIEINNIQLIVEESCLLPDKKLITL